MQYSNLRIVFKHCLLALFSLLVKYMQWRLVGFIEGGAQIFPSFSTMTTLNLPSIPVDFLNKIKYIF